MRVSIGDVRLYFEVLGLEWRLEDGALRRRPVLVGLHGGPGSDGTLMRNGALARFGDVAQVVVPDQRGHGRSDAASPASWNLLSWAHDVRALCRALEIERPIVCGISFGAFVAQKYAATFPDEPSGLILAAAAARYPEAAELAAQFRAVGGEEAATAARALRDAPSAETIARFASLCRPLLSLRATRAAVAGVGAGAIATPALELHFRRGEARTLDLRPELAAVRCPTLVVSGERDPLFPPRFAREIVGAIPDGLARLELLPDSAHNVGFDNPDAFNRSIRGFLAELTAG